MNNSSDRNAILSRATVLFHEGEDILHRRTDRMFAKLMIIQWLGGIIAALVLSPRSWAGAASQIHPHVWTAIFLGGAIASLPIFSAWKYPGRASTRHIIAVAQMLFSALLIHLTGGRIETHFHVFGSLAFLAFYRDPRVLVSATVVVALDHFIRGVFWPQSVFGVVTSSHWRWLEHADWVFFEDVFLLVSIRQNLEESRGLAERQASLERTNAEIEQRVADRTLELTNEMAERLKAEQAVRESQLLYHSLVEQLPICVYRKNAEGRFVFVNSQFCKIKNLTETQLLHRPTPHLPVSPLPVEEDPQHDQIMQTGAPLELEETYLQADGTRDYFQVVKLAVLDGEGRIAGSQGVYFNITGRKQAEEKLTVIHKQLVEASRQAGMAEVATSVLHNVGNVLNSVNVSGSLISEKIKSSRVGYVGKVADLINSQKENLPHFLTSDNRGRQLPAYLTSLATNLEQERRDLLDEINSLSNNISHIKEIVAMQQSYAKSLGVLESYKPSDLLEDAIRMNDAAIIRHEVSLSRDFADVPRVVTDKHKVLQILVNLIRNAKYACDDSGKSDKRIRFGITNGGDYVKISVADNGIGIPQENLTRIFNHGFTTRKEGHGFGLHSGALAAKELGGRLTVSSEGPGHGATFILELPVKHESTDL